mmetsp:Transcript_79034/g.180834  ORF Transcript_79034/g.180834 Transcript_79034/m.180834 type:complete len:538 (+) Transcript_79034:43-1656(+)|eukprot:CAMPEP_0204329480 /NCGR_PEP_ID=MMETSP0469-20131031/14182_1 /ASSEMBLY_ACC=CAM_ASM_000384 /TAXON_ID=2969 /ORGANISM="Oxyrrhis marina" /LENGTH=537 /DNA_ID=CAMNT_0051312077 /DNA_START=31 /DNA_END=1644 /DNA_ORIENTATION=-
MGDAGIHEFQGRLREIEVELERERQRRKEAVYLLEELQEATRVERSDKEQAERYADEWQTEVGSLRVEVEQLQREKDELTASLRRAQTALKESEAHRSQLQVDNARLELEASSATRLREAVEEDLHSTRAELEDCLADKHRLHRQLQEANLAPPPMDQLQTPEPRRPRGVERGEPKVLSKVLEILQSRNAGDSRRELVSLQEEHTNALRAVVDHKAANKELEERAQRLQEDLNESRSAVRILEMKVAEADAMRAAAEARLVPESEGKQACVKKCAELEAELRSAKKDLETVTTQARDEHRRLEEFQRDAVVQSCVSSQLIAERQRLQELAIKSERLEGENGRLRTDLQQARVDLDKAQTRCQSLAERTQRLEADAAAAAERSAADHAAACRLESRLQDANSKISNLDSELTVHAGQAQVASSTAAELRRDVERQAKEFVLERRQLELDFNRAMQEESSSRRRLQARYRKRISRLTVALKDREAACSKLKAFMDSELRTLQDREHMHAAERRNWQQATAVRDVARTTEERLLRAIGAA